jgi:hypothetical protein
MWAAGGFVEPSHARTRGMSPREQITPTMPVFERDQAGQREHSIALIRRRQRVWHSETLDAMPAVDAERHQRIERDPYEITDDTPMLYELMQPAFLFVREENGCVRIGHHREDVIGNGVEDRRKLLDRVATADPGPRLDEPGPRSKRSSDPVSGGTAVRLHAVPPLVTGRPPHSILGLASTRGSGDRSHALPLPSCCRRPTYISRRATSRVGLWVMPERWRRPPGAVRAPPTALAGPLHAAACRRR